jgi:rRNA 2'-O-methyltransferase fibrillarin
LKGASILTENFAPGKKVYGEKLISVDSREYRVWNPYRSKIGAAIASGLKSFGIRPGATVLYLGAASGTTVSHVSDIVGEAGRVYAVEFSAPVARELVGVAKLRSNLVPIIEDARRPLKYRMLVPMVDCLFADVAQPDQARIFALNAEYFLRNAGYFMISVKAGCIDSKRDPHVMFASVRKELSEARFDVEEEVDLAEFHGAHAVLVGTYRAK